MIDRPKKPLDRANRRARPRKARPAEAKRKTGYEVHAHARPLRNGAWQIDARLFTQGDPFGKEASLELAKAILLENRRAIAHGATRVRVRLQINSCVTNYIVGIPRELQRRAAKG